MPLRYHYCCDSVLTFLNWRLKKLSLEQNRISRIPYLQQVQIQSETEDWVEDRGSAHRESQSILHSKPWMDKAEDEQPDYTVLPMKKDVDRTGEWCLSFQDSNSVMGSNFSALFKSPWLPQELLQGRGGLTKDLQWFQWLSDRSS